MRNHVFLHLCERQVSEFRARWDEINNWLDEFPPFQPNQRFVDEQTKDILYKWSPKMVLFWWRKNTTDRKRARETKRRTTDALVGVTRHIHHDKLKIMMSPLYSQLEKCLSLRKSLFQEAGGCVETDPASPTLKQGYTYRAGDSFHLSNGSFFSCILA
jgi:hypothetical protein